MQIYPLATLDLIFKCAKHKQVFILIGTLFKVFALVLMVSSVSRIASDYVSVELVSKSSEVCDRMAIRQSFLRFLLVWHVTRQQI